MPINMNSLAKLLKNQEKQKKNSKDSRTAAQREHDLTAFIITEEQAAQMTKRDNQRKIELTRSKLRELVDQKVAGKITTAQMEERFYTILRKGFPLEWLADAEIRQYLLDKTGMSLEAANWFNLTFIDTIERLRAEHEDVKGQKVEAAKYQSSTIFCMNCGKKLPSTAKFCQFCGTKTLPPGL